MKRLSLIIPCAILLSPVSLAQVTFSVFTDPHPVMTGGTIGFAFGGDKFVGSVQGDGQRLLYSTDLLGNNVQPFAPTVNLPASVWDGEHAVAGSMGLGGFPRRDIYAAAGNGVVHISQDGTKSNVFVSGLLSGVTALRFDAVGTFGHDLLLATIEGQIYRISSSGEPTVLASIGEFVEGLDVAPLGAKFGSLDGQLIVTAENSGLLRAIDWSGKVTVLNQGNPIPLSESVNFVPLNLGKSGTSIEGFYQANFRPNIIKAEGHDFDGLQGDAIVSSEFGSLWRVHWNGAVFAITPLAPNPGQVEDGIFVTPEMIDPRSGNSCKAREDDDKDRKDASHRRDP